MTSPNTSSFTKKGDLIVNLAAKLKLSKKEVLDKIVDHVFANDKKNAIHPGGTFKTDDQDSTWEDFLGHCDCDLPVSYRTHLAQKPCIADLLAVAYALDLATFVFVEEGDELRFEFAFNADVPDKTLFKIVVKDGNKFFFDLDVPGDKPVVEVVSSSIEEPVEPQAKSTRFGVTSSPSRMRTRDGRYVSPRSFHPATQLNANVNGIPLVLYNRYAVINKVNYLLHQLERQNVQVAVTTSQKDVATDPYKASYGVNGLPLWSTIAFPAPVFSKGMKRLYKRLRRGY